MEALINSWRKLWNDADIPFYYVQIAPFYYSKSAGKYPLTKETLPQFWEAQELAMKIPHTGMAVTTDLINTPDDLHPGFKWEVGRRLAQWPLAIDYDLKVNPSGPVYKKMRIKGDKIKLRFQYTGKGLTGNDGKTLSQFEIAGADGKYHPAKAEIKGKKVIVSSAQVKHPVNARFAWNEGGKANFYNKDGLPAMPFRTNNPLINQYKYTGVN
jgi:sialate O-acetylesterase